MTLIQNTITNNIKSQPDAKELNVSSIFLLRILVKKIGNDLIQSYDTR